MNFREFYEVAPPEWRKLPHRGAKGDIATFASRFLEDRFVGFEKDMAICLSGRPAETRGGLTYAYFPALKSCCGMLEYLACFYHGRDRCDVARCAAYAEAYMPQPQYDTEAVRILMDALRHPVAHHGIASGVWIDRRDGRRLTWEIGPGNSAPAVTVRPFDKVLQNDPPWDCVVTHRIHIQLGRLWKDIRDSALSINGYRDQIAINADLQRRFARFLKRLYPE